VTQLGTNAIVRYPFTTEHGLDVDPAALALQERGPIPIQLPYGEPCWIATRYEDVRTVHGDKRFGKAMGVGRDVPRLNQRPAIDPNSLAMLDAPRHTRIRKLTSATFAKPKVMALSDWVDRFVGELLDEMGREAARGDGTFDFMTYSWTLPNHVVTGILGVRRGDVPMFRGWIDRMLSHQATIEERVEMSGRLQEYIRGLIAERRKTPTDDVLSELVAARDADDRLTEDELVMLFQSLFLGGFETTVAELGSMVFTLLSQRDHWQELVEYPDLMPAAMEELWRWIPTFRYGFPHVRWAMEDIELSDGVVIPYGEPILPERPLGNRDETVFPHADLLDFHRENPAPHLSLGWGAHHCVGAHVAHLELELSLRALLVRYPTLKLAVAPDQVQWSTKTMLRSPERLPVRW
jgi:cytochrome P450